MTTITRRHGSGARPWLPGDTNGEGEALRPGGWALVLVVLVLVVAASTAARAGGGLVQLGATLVAVPAAGALAAAGRRSGGWPARRADREPAAMARPPDDRPLRHPATGTCRTDHVLTPMVRSWRESGVDVRYHPRPIAAAVGDATLAGIVDTLLDNAAVHAAGSSVRIVTHHVLDQLVVSVIDDGPGICTDLDGDVLEAGVRRPGSPGPGRGLAEAASLARSAGGELRLVEAAEGTWVSVRLPALPGPAPA